MSTSECLIQIWHNITHDEKLIAFIGGLSVGVTFVLIMIVGFLVWFWRQI